MAKEKNGETIAHTTKKTPSAIDKKLRSFFPSLFINRIPDVINKDRKSTRLNSSHVSSSYAVFCLKKKIIVLLLLFFSVAKNLSWQIARIIQVFIFSIVCLTFFLIYL